MISKMITTGKKKKKKMLTLLFMALMHILEFQLGCGNSSKSMYLLGNLAAV